MVDHMDVLKSLRDLGNTTVSLADIKAAVDKTDRQALTSKHGSRVEFKVWDGLTDLNGISKDVWRERHDMKEGDCAYLMYVDGNLTQFQPHDPDQIGRVPFTKTGASSKGKAMAGLAVEAFVDSDVRKKVLESFL